MLYKPVRITVYECVGAKKKYTKKTMSIQIDVNLICNSISFNNSVIHLYSNEYQLL